VKIDGMIVNTVIKGVNKVLLYLL